MFDITSRLNVTRTLGSTVMLGIMLFLFLPAATYAAPLPALSLKANPVKVGKGGNATLSWASQNTKSCTASGGWSGSKGTSGSQTVKNITSSQTYKLTCAGTTKNVSAAVKVLVALPPPPPPPPQIVVGLNPAPARVIDDAFKSFTLELGAHSVRTEFPHEKNNIEWAAQNGKSVVLMLGYGKGCNAKTASGRQCYADRSAQLVQTYGNKVEYYEVWNEWHGQFGPYGDWKQNQPRSAEYTDLLCRTYDAIKAVAPNARVAGGVIAGASETALRGILDNGAGDCMDVLSLHYYPYRQNLPGHVPANAPGAVGAQSVIDIMTARYNLFKARTGKDIPVILTETGFHGNGDGPDRLEAEFLTELYRRAAAVPFLEGIWWFQLKDNPIIGTTFGLLRGNDTKKPAFDAYKAVARDISIY